MRRILIALLTLASFQVGAQVDKPARPPVQGCHWEKLSSSPTGLVAWIQQCDFGWRKIRLFFDSAALMIQYSDGGSPQSLIDVIDQLPGETPQITLQRIFSARTLPAISARCVLTEYLGYGSAAAGKQRFTFVPDAAFRKELAAQANPNEVPDPPCGEWGEQPDGIQYFEASTQARSRKLLFVRIGQEEPLFDAQTLQLIEPESQAGAVTSPVDGGAPCCTYQAGAAGIDADFLLETCSVTGQTAYGKIPFFDCQSYVLAVLDTYRSLHAASS